MISYRSEHPNHVHQLAASVSKHYYASKDGYLKYQKKPMEVRLDALHEQDRAHMVLFSIRDHCSGLFYAEVAFGPTLPSMTAFLSRAWSPKADYAFYGVPKLLTIPRTVEVAFPGLSASVRKLGIELVGVTSGFQSGIRDLRTIDDALYTAEGQSLDVVARCVQDAYLYQANEKSRNGAESKLELWRRGVPMPRSPHAGWVNDA